ncbi:MAG: Ca2+-transporting ATPase [Parcubacteria group bacterium Gr01-1014_29]|nr:MAG: Ca2+-transporting ATPase [Parcubacteria group bacterium Gr01-1014_29]
MAPSSSGLGQMVLIHQTGVRFPVGPPIIKWYHSTMTSFQKKDIWHAISERELAKRFETSGHAGLSVEEAQHRRERLGENRITGGEEFHLFSIILHQLANPLIIILLGAGIISFFLDERTDALVIFLTVLINTIVGVVQEGKASRAFLKLQEHVTKRAVVLREGIEHEVFSYEVVPGDSIILRAGDWVPADARILEVHNLRTNESALTGEWIDIEKKPGTLAEKTRLVDRTNMVWAGTLVEDGWAKALVVNTANYTEFGKISVLVNKTHKVKTPLQKSMASLAKVISVCVLLVVVVIFALGVFRGESVAHMFVTSVAIAVAAVPEGLPIAVTVILALGMERILRNGGLVKKLTAAETLGSTTIILTDKTGTLTQANMQVSHVVTGGQIFGSPSDVLTQEAHASAALTIGVSTSDAFIENPDADLGNWVVRGTPTDKALLLAGIQAGVAPPKVLAENPRIDFLPFEAERRFAASLHKTKKGTLLRISGAPEVLLDLATRVYVGGHTMVLTKQKRNVLRKKYEELTKGGNRVLATAYRKEIVERIPVSNGQDFFGKLVFVGMIAFHDPLRPDVAQSMQLARQAGLRVIMVTGDHKLTAERIAEEVGIDVVNQVVLEGEDLEGMTPEELLRRVDSISVYARVLPHQKLRIVEAWQKKGAVVAMTGDGVNDAPALKRANVGVALGSGTEVAKEASDIVLLKDSFSVLVSAIEQGRVILDNLRKVITFVFATGFTEIVLVGGSLLAGFPLPVLATQILWTNLVGEGLLNFAFAFEPREHDVMRPRQMRERALFTREMWFLIFIIGIATDVILFGTFLYLESMEYTIEHIRTVMFMGLALDSIFFAYSLRSLRQPIWRIRVLGNPFFFFSFAISIGLLVLAFVFEPLGNLLSVTSLWAVDYWIIFALGVIDLLLIEAGKWWFIRRGEAE